MEFDIKILDLSHIDERIKHLSESDIIALITKYYDGATVTQLKKEYQIKVNSSQLIHTFPPKLTKKKCPYCDVSMVEDWEAKKSYSFQKNLPYCPSCKHEDSEDCSCGKCRQIREKIKIEEEKRKRELIHQAYNSANFNKVNEENLTLEDRLFLSILVRGGLDENLNSINPITSFEEKLTPTNTFTIELIKTLIARNLIKPDCSSAIDAFEDDEDFPNTYYIKMVNYRINIKPSDESYRNMIQRLLYPSQEEFEKDKEFCFTMWKKIALNEVFEYLLFSMKKVGYDFNPGPKTTKVFEHLLEFFSVSQIYCIIYRGIANSTKLYQERQITKKHAANSVISLCESYGERVIAEGWNLTHYHRNYELPETLIYKVFFTSILKIASLGFEEKPTSNF